MRTAIISIISLIACCAVGRGATIKKTCIGGDSPEDYNLAWKMIREHDQDAFLKLCLQGRAEAFEAGEKVGFEGFSGVNMVKIRKVGDTQYFLIPAECVEEVGE
jgi:hypothetical protein